MPVHSDRLAALFMELAAVPSPSRHEKSVAALVAERVRALGLTAEEDDAGRRIGGNCGNLLVRVPATGRGPRILLGAHLDTVEEPGADPIRPLRQGEDIVSDGSSIVAADDKTGVAVLLELLQALREERVPHGELLVAFTVAEEIELLGSSALRPDRYRDLNYGVVLDHSMPEEIVLGAPTKVALRITMRGVGGHAAHPERRINALQALATAVGRLPGGRLDEISTANLGILRGGSRINIIPEEAYAEYELRSHDSARAEFHTARVVEILQATAAEHRIYVTGADTGLGGDGTASADPVRRARVEIDVQTCYHAYRHRQDAPIVERAAAAVRAAGGEARYVIAQGGSDANILNHRGLPTVNIGCGMHGAHSMRERANLPEMTRAVRVLTELVRGESA